MTLEQLDMAYNSANRYYEAPSHLKANCGTFFIDDFVVGCPDDDDGDGMVMDCDDTSAAHWFDCGQCVDLDGDDHGDGCDLGPDCDDADASVQC